MKMFLNLVLVVIIHNVLAAEPIDHLDTNKTNTPFKNYPPQFFMKQQNPSSYELKGGPASIFVQVPGLLSPSLSHQTPALYEISFHGACRFDTEWTNLFLRLRVDGHLIIVNSLTSSMSVTNNNDGSYMESNSQTQLSWFQCSKTDWIYLSAGKHIAEVVAKTSNAVRINGGVLKIKLTQFDHGTNINMPLITPQTIDRI